MRVAFLGSGSSGNATAIESDGAVVLVDAGFSARETLRRLALAGMSAEKVRAVLVTHEHADHASGIRVLTRRLKVPVYATAGTVAAAGIDACVADPRRVKAGDTFSVASMRIHAFALSHDAVEPVGYRIEGACGTAFGIATDTGVLTCDAHEALTACDVLALECNHDEDMLRNGPYPWFLKQRILSSVGHLSNHSACRSIERLLSGRLETIVGMHLSQQNNDAELVRDCLTDMLRREDHPATVKVASQNAGLVLAFGER